MTYALTLFMNCISNIFLLMYISEHISTYSSWFVLLSGKIKMVVQHSESEKK